MGRNQPDDDRVLDRARDTQCRAAIAACHARRRAGRRALRSMATALGNGGSASALPRSPARARPTRRPRRPGRSTSGCAAAIARVPIACRGDHSRGAAWVAASARAKPTREAWVRSRSTIRDGGKEFGLDERVEQVESRQRAERDQRNHRQRRQEARRARSRAAAMAGDRPASRAPPSSERSRSTGSRRTRSGRRDQATPTWRGPLSKSFSRRASFDRTNAGASSGIETAGAEVDAQES